MTICCAVTCPERMECAKFARALEVNSGRKAAYEIVECINFSEYEKKG